MSSGPAPPAGYQKYLSVGLQLSATLLLGFFTGYFLDRKFRTLPCLTLGGTALGFLTGFYNLLSQLGKKQNENSEK